jgi:DNA-binding MarR family transcriptional regulator
MIKEPLSRRPLTDEGQQTAFGIHAMLKEFMIACEDRQMMPLQYLTSFLLVAQEEGLPVQDYAERARVSKSVMSRHLLDIGDRTRTGEPGLGLVTSRPKPMNLREHEVLLTPKGRALVGRMRHIWKMSSK